MLIGNGALANYHDVPAEHAEDFNHWHSAEHLPERVGVPGFLRGRRYRAEEPGVTPEYFILYETSDVQVLGSAPYLARLDEPTPWTARVSAHMGRTIRTAAAVRASAGRGTGGYVLTVRLAPAAGDKSALRAALSAQAMAAIVARPGVCGAHVLEADAAITSVDTAERRMREPPDEMVPWMVLLEGTAAQPLAGAWDALAATLPPISPDDMHTGTYALQAMFSLCDL